MKILPVIMAGGNGSRLWPLSRVLYPKQFLRLDGQYTMLQETVRRLDGLSCAAPLVICNEAHRFLVAEQLRAINKLAGNIILEPAGRNTAPAVALAALTAQEPADEVLLLVLAADHVIRAPEAFISAIQAASAYAEAGQLVTFGIVPTSPETGYGYIRRGDAQPGGGFTVAQFVEKPNADKARHYLETGEYYWNSGMFLFRASRYLEELQAFRPDIFAACSQAIGHPTNDMDFIRVNETAFLRCPDDSIDYAVMEKTADAVVVPLDAGWSDVGSWSSLWDISRKSDEGNVQQGDVLFHASHDNYVYAESSLVTLLGVDDLVVVQTKDATLVAHRNQVQEVKTIVDGLKSQGRTEHRVHREVFRPWGKFDSIDKGQRFQVKHITVRPGEKLSLQMHHHRAEHWIVVSGTARVTNGDAVQLLTENQSIYIPLGQVHALENPGLLPLELIEVQSGAYLGEDDIVRLEDRYGRL